MAAARPRVKIVPKGTGLNDFVAMQEGFFAAGIDRFIARLAKRILYPPQTATTRQLARALLAALGWQMAAKSAIFPRRFVSIG
jgi:hypothetical protein